jgi:hypothetical protein
VDGNASRTGWTSFGYTFASAGVHTIAFGVIDIGDYDGTSTLAVADVGVSAVPEAPAGAMLAAGLACIAGVARRRARKD